MRTTRLVVIAAMLASSATAAVAAPAAQGSPSDAVSVKSGAEPSFGGKSTPFDETKQDVASTKNNIPSMMEAIRNDIRVQLLAESKEKATMDTKAATAPSDAVSVKPGTEPPFGGKSTPLDETRQDMASMNDQILHLLMETIRGNMKLATLVDPDGTAKKDTKGATQSLKVTLYRVRAARGAADDGAETNLVKGVLTGVSGTDSVAGRLAGFGAVERIGEAVPVVMGDSADVVNEDKHSYEAHVTTDPGPTDAKTGTEFGWAKRQRRITLARMPGSGDVAWEIGSTPANGFDYYTSHGETVVLPQTVDWTERGFTRLETGRTAVVVVPDLTVPGHAGTYVYAIEPTTPVREGTAH